ncbi:hypothetical protein [Sphingobacterium luzhongxinii]|nr:hypothetical protein [Sphingobacterium sp. xlx-73]
MTKKTGNKGQGTAGGWPSTTGEKSGKGRSNQPPKPATSATPKKSK